MFCYNSSFLELLPRVLRLVYYEEDRSLYDKKDVVNNDNIAEKVFIIKK